MSEQILIALQGPLPLVEVYDALLKEGDAVASSHILLGAMRQAIRAVPQKALAGLFLWMGQEVEASLVGGVVRAPLSDKPLRAAQAARLEPHLKAWLLWSMLEARPDVAEHAAAWSRFVALLDQFRELIATEAVRIEGARTPPELTLRSKADPAQVKAFIAKLRTQDQDVAPSSVTLQ